MGSSDGVVIEGLVFLGYSQGIFRICFSQLAKTNQFK